MAAGGASDDEDDVGGGEDDEQAAAAKANGTTERLIFIRSRPMRDPSSSCRAPELGNSTYYEPRWARDLPLGLREGLNRAVRGLVVLAGATAVWLVACSVGTNAPRSGTQIVLEGQRIQDHGTIDVSGQTAEDVHAEDFFF